MCFPGTQHRIRKKSQHGRTTCRYTARLRHRSALKDSTTKLFTGLQKNKLIANYLLKVRFLGKVMASPLQYGILRMGKFTVLHTGHRGQGRSRSKKNPFSYFWWYFLLDSAAAAVGALYARRAGDCEDKCCSYPAETGICREYSRLHRGSENGQAVVNSLEERQKHFDRWVSSLLALALCSHLRQRCKYSLCYKR